MRLRALQRSPNSAPGDRKGGSSEPGAGVAGSRLGPGPFGCWALSKWLYGPMFAGTWFLVAVGSACHFLQEHGYQAEATALHTAPQGAAMAVSTFRKLDGICWQVRQLFGDTGVPGRFLLQARSLPVSNSALSVFEQRVRGANLTEDQVFFFPKYGFCKTADQFHILDEWSLTLGGKHCDAWSYMLIPATKPGQFTVDIKGSRPGADSEEVQVIETDYTKFALMLSSRQTSSQTIIRVSLLGRKWRLPYKTINKFVCLTRAQNLTKNNFVFPDVTDWLTDPSVC